jgi:argininosuccinate lyase
MVNQLVTEGVPFREAYKTVGLAIEAGTYTYHTDLHHTHEGSIGNLCNQEIASQLAATLARFPFSEVAQALEGLKGNK